MSAPAPSWPALVEQARAARARGERNAALDAFQQAQALRPTDTSLAHELAGELQALGRLDEAREVLQQRLATQPTDISAWGRFGLVEKQAGQLPQALAHWQQALALKPGHPTWSLEAAQALQELNRLDEAESLLAALLATTPDHLGAWMRRGYLARKRNQPGEALQHFQRALALKPEHSTLPLEIATELQAAQRWDEIETVLAQHLERQPEDITGWLRRGFNARRRGERAQALLCFQTVLGLKPGHASAWAEVPVELQALGRGADALAHLEAGQRQQPENPEVAIALAKEYRAQQRTAQAHDVLMHALQHHPQNAALHTHLGYTLRGLQQPERSVEHFIAAFEADPTRATVLYEISTGLCELKRFDEALSWLDRMPAPLNTSGGLWRQRGLVALCRGDTPGAIASYQHGVADDPGNVECHIALVNEYMKAGLFESALASLEAGRKAVEDDMPLSLIQGRLLRSQGWTEQAIAHMTQHCEAYPQHLEGRFLLFELHIKLGQFEAAEALLAQLPPPQTAYLEFRHRIARAQLARARYQLHECVAWFEQALAVDQSGILDWDPYIIYQMLLRGLQPARATMTRLRDLMARHPSLTERIKVRESRREVPGFHAMIWYELQTNPIAAQALTEALARPRSERLSALGQAFADDPGHAGTAMAWLITAHEAGVWQRPHLLPGKKRLIPTKVVQFWDTAELPSDILACMQSWPQVCKGVEHQVFNAASARAFLRRECSAAVVQAFQVANHPAMQADLFRLAYLSVHGGVYADADDRCRHAITDWLEPGCELLLLQEDHGSLGNNFLAAAPRHPFICALLERVTQNILARQGDNIWFISGPGAITVAFCEHYAQALSQGELPEGVKVLDMYQVYQRVSMHLPRAYKQDDRHWASRKAASRPLFNHMVKLNRR